MFQQYRVNIFDQDRRSRSNMYDMGQRCPNCKKIKDNVNHLCKIACIYCHDLHSSNELIENLCPAMYQTAKKAQEKNSYLCKICKGEGFYTQETETIRYESMIKYQTRLREWNFARKHQQNQQIQKPVRKILLQQKKVKQMKCSECDGKGRIIRMISCCLTGCVSCNRDKYKVNPVWKKYRMLPVKNQVMFNCSICLMDVEQNDDIFTLDCKHEFHYGCIIKWIKSKGNCPVCRQRDIYLQGIDFPEDYQVEAEGIMIVQNNSNSSEDYDWGIND